MTERAVLAGGCFWGMQDLIRKLPGVLSTRVGYTGGDVPNATYRDHGTHAEGIEIVFDPEKTSYRDLLEFFFQIHDPSTKNRQGNDVGAAYRSAIYYETMRRSGLPWTPSPTSTHQACGPARSSPRSSRSATSGTRSRSTRTTSSGSRTATPATSRDAAGNSRAGMRRSSRRARHSSVEDGSDKPRPLHEYQSQRACVLPGSAAGGAPGGAKTVHSWHCTRCDCKRISFAALPD